MWETLCNQRHCVEVADNLVGVVAVGDSKDPDGPALRFLPGAWADFVRSTRADSAR
jgi:hypothetical protein